MSKSLKDFISDHRKEFDEDHPPASGWHHLERAIGANKPVKEIGMWHIYKWSAAAAVFFIVSVGIYFLAIKKDGDDREITQKKVQDTTDSNSLEINPIDPTYAAEAKKIFRSIESQQKQLAAIATEQPELYSQFSSDLATLDSSYRVLKAQALQTPNREVIIRAMLQNLQLQAELLAKQLSILNEYKQDKPKQNEKDTSLRI